MLNGSLTAAATELATRIATRDAQVGVIGLGAVGGVSARLIAASGYRVTGVDRNPARIAELRGLADYRDVDMHGDIAALAEADVVFVAVRVESRAGVTDLAAARAALRALAAATTRSPLILFESTVPPGSTRALATEIFGADSLQFALTAHCPERLRVGDGIDAIRATPRLVGGLSDTATSLGAAFLERLGVTPVPASNPETTELSKLLENTFLTTGIALMGEVTRLAHAMGISGQEVARAAATKTHGYFPFRPGAGIGGHCLMNDLGMLRSTAARAGLESPMLDGVQHAAARLTDTVVERLERLMAENRLPLDGARVGIVGVGFKPDSADVTNSAAIDLVRALRTRGAEVGYIDSLVADFAVDGARLARLAPEQARSLQALLVLGGDRDTDLAMLAAHVPATLDASGRRLLKEESPHAAAL
jgi:UDP-N-acetyl-D-glucosamine dehydrogenase